MNIGMLWFDNDQKTDLKQRVERAADYYARKYGKKPNLCFVHPSMLPQPGNNVSTKNDYPDGNYQAGQIEVRPSASLLPNHFWIGVERKEINAVLA